MHEEHAVALAHGYARVTGRPLAVALHSNVGLMHATMAIFNAWCDRIPICMLGGVGPIDAVKRRPWVDWIHTSRDLGALVRGYTKWDDQPGSVPAALEAILRAYRIAMTLPHGPVYVCSRRGAAGGTARAPPGAAGARPLSAAVAAGSGRGSGGAQRPRPAAEARAPADPDRPRDSAIRDDCARRIALAERLGAAVLTDIKTGAGFPTTHPLHPFPPSLYVTARPAPPDPRCRRDPEPRLDRPRRHAAAGLRGRNCRRRKVIQCSLDQYIHNGWSMDYQTLPPAEIAMLAPPDPLVAALARSAPRRVARSVRACRPGAERRAPVAAPPHRTIAASACRIDDLAADVTAALAPHRPSYIRLPLGWPGEYCRFAASARLHRLRRRRRHRLGPGHGGRRGARAAGGGRLPVAVLGDGDYLMGVTALWTGVHYRVPVLIVIANNESFFNDELHQERMARMRGRPVENRWIGVRMRTRRSISPSSREGQGAAASGRCATPDGTRGGPGDAVSTQVRAGKVCVMDVSVAPEYARVTVYGHYCASSRPVDAAVKSAVEKTSEIAAGKTKTRGRITMTTIKAGLRLSGLCAPSWPWLSGCRCHRSWTGDGCGADRRRQLRRRRERHAVSASPWHKGYFKEEGANITGIISSQGGGTSVRNMMAGGVAYGEANPGAIAVAILQGADLKIISDNVLTVAEFVWAVKPELADQVDRRPQRASKIGYTNPRSTSQALAHPAAARRPA